MMQSSNPKLDLDLDLLIPKLTALGSWATPVKYYLVGKNVYFAIFFMQKLCIQVYLHTPDSTLTY